MARATRKSRALVSALAAAGIPPEITDRGGSAAGVLDRGGRPVTVTPTSTPARRMRKSRADSVPVTSGASESGAIASAARAEGAAPSEKASPTTASMNMHMRLMHPLRITPSPPRLGMSRQKVHAPHSSLVQPAQVPQRRRRLARLPAAFEETAASAAASQLAAAEVEPKGSGTKATAAPLAAADVAPAAVTPTRCDGACKPPSRPAGVYEAATWARCSG